MAVGPTIHMKLFPRLSEKVWLTLLTFVNDVWKRTLSHVSTLARYDRIAWRPSWWPHVDSMAKGTVPNMGRDSRCYTGRLMASASSAGAAAEMAACRTYAKYAALPGSYLFQPIALETLGSINESAVQFWNNIGHRIASTFADDKEEQYPFQWLLLLESFVSNDDPDYSHPAF